MENQRFAEYCVYTIVEGKKLARSAKTAEPLTFDEQKPWVTAGKLFEKTRSTKVGMPVLFGDAADCSRLLFWELLTDVQVSYNRTRIAVDRLRKLRRTHKPQELVLRSSGKKIAPNFIRPYAICETPDFLALKDTV